MSFLPIYLPIAELPVDLLLLLAIGGSVGILSGMFGVGGGFLMTPLLLFVGVPAHVAVASGANHVAGTSVSGVMAYWRRGAVDFKMGAVMSAGGTVGCIGGVILFAIIREAGLFDLVLSLAYIILLGGVGAMMLVESLRATLRLRRTATPLPSHPLGRHRPLHFLPLRMRFHQSQLYISAIPPFLLGALAGLLAAIMGVGGGFFLVPAMIYRLRMPTLTAVGTSLFQIIFITSLVTLLHAVQNNAVDLLLALILIMGGAAGAQLGARLAARLPSESLRILLALLVLGVGARLAYELVRFPDELFSLSF